MDLEQTQHHHGLHLAEKQTLSVVKKPSNHQDHHSHMAEDYRKRFWISLVLTLPILILSPMIQEFVGLGERLRFSGDQYVLSAKSKMAISGFKAIPGKGAQGQVQGKDVAVVSPA